MVNKAVLVLVALVALWTAGVGAFVGSYVDGPLLGTGTGSPTPSVTATHAPNPTATPSPTATPQPTIAPAVFDERAIERAVLVAVNAERAERDRGPLYRFEAGDEMARFHSENMAVEATVAHEADGYTARQRYRKFGLAECSVADDSNTGIREGKQIETVGATVAGRPFEVDGERHVHRNESAVASAVVDRWMGQSDARQKLLFSNARRVGIGVVVAEDGRTYVTLDLC